MFSDSEHPRRIVDVVARKGGNVQTDTMPTSNHYYYDQARRIAPRNIADAFAARPLQWPSAFVCIRVGVQKAWANVGLPESVGPHPVQQCPKRMSQNRLGQR
ncbi:unnamed protein product [Prorocentrum cordatum]|uniref:Uncharacterized protein n=1 Tax=Prorocentrum cordatum TaxID=2364126 RepID=A0ABN9R5Y4_9DINO|nr:unnamed protein product [Polarella glacialis]